MSLNRYRNATRKLCEKKQWNDLSVEQILMLLMEEVGELAGAVRQELGLFPTNRKRTNVGEEMLDVMSYIFQLSSIMNIDLNRQWMMHHKKACKKTYTWSPHITGGPELHIPLLPYKSQHSIFFSEDGDI